MKKKSRIKKLSFAVIIAFAVISFWRGIWGLMDVYLYPDDYTKSLWISLIVGFLILVWTHQAIKELL